MLARSQSHFILVVILPPLTVTVRVKLDVINRGLVKYWVVVSGVVSCNSVWRRGRRAGPVLAVSFRGMVFTPKRQFLGGGSDSLLVPVLKVVSPTFIRPRPMKVATLLVKMMTLVVIILI